MHQIFEIICSFHNAFGNPLYRDNGQAMVEDVSEMKRRQSQLENDVHENEAVDTGWNRGNLEKFKKLDMIPEYDLTDLRKLACGPYVLGLAAKYFQHSKNVIYRHHKDYPDSIQITGIISRHSKNDENVSGYTVYIRFPGDGTFGDTVSYCKCKVGTRTAGLCAHETAGLYMLYHWYNEIPMPKKHLSSKHEQYLTQFIDCTWYQGAGITLLSDAVDPADLIDSESDTETDSEDDTETESESEDQEEQDSDIENQDTYIERNSAEEDEEKEYEDVAWENNPSHHNYSNHNNSNNRQIRRASTRKRPLSDITNDHNPSTHHYNTRSKTKRQKTCP